MKEIKLTKNQIALIDNEDYELISRYTWYAEKDNNTYYARTDLYKFLGRHKKVSMHRFLMNAKEGQFIDHINSNGLDNRRENLRFCTKQQNHFNTIKTSKKASPLYKGVSWYKKERKWGSRIKVNGKQFHLGYFHNEIDAAKAYNKAALEYFGEFAKINKLKGGE